MKFFTLASVVSISALSVLVMVLVPQEVSAFVLTFPQRSLSTTQLLMTDEDSNVPFEIKVSLPPSNSGIEVEMRVEPVLSVPSELVEVRYKLPFGLDVAPKDNLAVCTKDGPGGERVGDVLRFSSQWTLGLPQGEGLAETVAAFSGGVKWRCTMFDVAKAGSWEEVVEALTSNVDSRTDEVVLVFERPLNKEK